MDTSSSGTSGPASTSEGDTSTSDPVEESSSSTGGLGTASLGTSSSSGFVDDPETDTDEPVTEVLLDLYEDCGRGEWETFEQGLVPTNCDFTPGDPHAIGGGWRFEMFNSPTYGEVEKALVIRPGPFDDGVTQVSFNSGERGFSMAGTRLVARYEFVNTDVGAVDSGTMTFQILRVPPKSAPGEGMTLLSEEAVSGASGIINLDLDIAGPMDDLLFFVLADSSEPNQGVALYEPVIVPAR